MKREDAVDLIRTIIIDSADESALTTADHIMDMLESIGMAPPARSDDGLHNDVHEWEK